ncbi:MAG: 50S ribosomal protein L25/general stress protein Ctc [Gammaproteobacteria bacterium]|nr:50S ribosomal protein L25/general stress protein Ctc [Gammaproteobacteria bacterium]
MKKVFEIEAQDRVDTGKGASRRLRRQGLVPGILYGAADRPPRMISLVHHELAHHLEVEAFYSHILTLKIGDQEQDVILKDLQRHPAKPFVLHVDFQRVRATEKLRTNIPVHFINEEICVGIKMGGLLSRHITDLEVVCLPADLPEYISVDVSKLEIGDSVLLSELEIPEGVELTALAGGADDLPVASVHSGHMAEEVEGEEEGEGGSAEGGSAADAATEE